MPQNERSRALLAFADLAHEVCEDEMSESELVELARALLNEHGDTLRSAAIAIKEIKDIQS